MADGNFLQVLFRIIPKHQVPHPFHLQNLHTTELNRITGRQVLYNRAIVNGCQKYMIQPRWHDLQLQVFSGIPIKFSEWQIECFAD